MSWQGEANDVVFLSFALEEDEVERIVPAEVPLDTRTHEGGEYAFITLGLVSYSNFYFENFPLLSVDYPKAFLTVSIRDSSNDACFYLKRLFSPRLQGLFLRWLGGFPTRVMAMDFPTRAHPGGEYRWKLSNGGVGILRGKIERRNGATGRLCDLFDSEQKMVDFFWNREDVYSGTPGSMTRARISLPVIEAHPIVFEKLDLGFLAEDMERHQFPQAVLGSFFVPEVTVQFSGPEPQEL